MPFLRGRKLLYAGAAIVVVALTTASAAAVAPGLSLDLLFESGPAGNAVPIGESVTRGGITVTLESLSTTSSETRAIFRFRNAGAVEWPIKGYTVTGPFETVGFDESLPVSLTGYKEEDSRVWVLTLGRAIDENVSITLPGVFIAGTYGDYAEITESFSFRASVDIANLDPIDKTVPLSLSGESSEGASVDVMSLHLSSSGLQLRITPPLARTSSMLRRD